MTLDGLLYTKEHEWMRIDGDIAVVGITDYAQGELGDIVFVELPAPGKMVASGDVALTVEAVKAVSDVYAPVAGKIVAVNDVLRTAPDTVNKDPYGTGWMVKIKMSAPGDFSGLLSPSDYKKLIAES